MKINKILWTSLAVSIITTSLYSKELKGKVVNIADGDTVTIVVADDNAKSKFLQPLSNQLSSKKQYRIRLNDIDAPESKQAFGNKSKENLKNYIYQKDVVIDYESTDRYGRILGTIYYQNKDINLQQVKDGYAWVYKQYSNKQNYIKAEREARSSKKGLWRDNNPTEPWEYRKQKKEKNESFKVSEIREGIFYRKNQQEDTLLSVGDEIYNDDIVYQEEAINSNLSFFILELKTGEKVKIGSKGLDDILYDELFNSKDLSSMGYVDITEEETMSGEEKEEESHSKGENK